MEEAELKHVASERRICYRIVTNSLSQQASQSHRVHCFVVVAVDVLNILLPLLCRGLRMTEIRKLLYTWYARLNGSYEQQYVLTSIQGNLDERCTDALVWELMLQAGPVGEYYSTLDNLTSH